MLQTAAIVEKLFFAALEFEDSVARSAFLDLHCGTAEVRRQVEELLDLDPQARGFLETSAPIPTVSVDLTPTPGPEGIGAVVGPYRLLEVIGEGGMGTVYSAEQVKPVRREVALKLIKRGMDSAQLIARFAAERQALALMDHPNIARVLDAGTADSGTPYFVMELVEGHPITECCGQANLPVSERLELFILVCRAVQHAHQKGIIHRDLKPSNVLVTTIDGVKVPKVIDFGIAKATGSSLLERPLATGVAQLVGTPLYMSPEQAEGSKVDVDTRSDVYSLGVLLYELLTTTTPIDQETVRAVSLDEIRRIIREEEPPTPSSRLRMLRGTAPDVPTVRHVGLNHSRRPPGSELDWITMKALQKDRNRRYESAGALASDIRRYLDGEAVEAHPPSIRYRLGKLARRHRTLLSTAVLVAVTLAAGAGIGTWQAVRATRASAEAERRAAEAERVVDYLIEDVFGAAALERPRGRDVTVVEVLVAADRTIGSRFQGHPLVEAEIRYTLGRLYSDLGRRAEALTQYEQAFDLRRSHLGDDHPLTLVAAHELVYWLGMQDETDAAIALGRTTLAIRRRVLGPLHPDTILSQGRLGFVMRRSEPHLDEALVLSSGAASAAPRVFGPDHLMTYHVLDELGMVHQWRGEHREAEVLFREVVDGFGRIYGTQHPSTLWARWHLVRSLTSQGRLEEARRELSAALEVFQTVFGVDHPEIRSLLSQVVDILRNQGDEIGVRNLAHDWIGRVAVAPVPLDPWARRDRAAMLSYLTLLLVTLPDPIRFDAALAAGAAEEGVALGGTSPDPRGVQGLVALRTGRIDRALRAVEAIDDRPATVDEGQLYWAARALIYAHCGRLGEAQSSLDRCESVFDDVSWARWSDEIRRLRSEARALIEKRWDD